jgi:Na+/H+ antiporter NhaC
MRRPIAPILLVVAWAVLSGGFYYSFFGQLESTARNDVSGLSNMAVVGIKGAVYAVVIVALVLSVRRLTRQLGTSTSP